MSNKDNLRFTKSIFGYWVFSDEKGDPMYLENYWFGVKTTYIIDQYLKHKGIVGNTYRNHDTTTYIIFDSEEDEAVFIMNGIPWDIND